MFTTCIYCAANLEQNEALEVFPVGKRLAFDPAQGRLWVVCRSCERWNLSPLDERWEAIEQMERRYRDSRLRVSTDNVGLARLREGLDLIRIGEPQRPEMAAWRYGDQFGRRRKRQMLVTGAAVGAVSAVYVGGMALGASLGGFVGVMANGGWWDALVNGSPSKVVGRITAPDGRLLIVQRKHARMSAIERTAAGDPMVLRLEHTLGTLQLTGSEAMRAAAQLLPTVNRFGGSKASVNEAVSYLETAGGPLETLDMIQRTAGWTDRHRRPKRRADHIELEKIPGSLHALPLRERLALEMALHEERERRAMQGELEELERAWREAEEVAAIADSMFESPAIEGKLEKLKLNADSGRHDDPNG